MATKAGQVNEFLNVEEFDKQKKYVMDGLADIAVEMQKVGTKTKKSGGVTDLQGNQAQQNALTEKAIKGVKELTLAEAKHAEQIRLKNQAIKEEARLDKEIVGAYQAASNELKKRIKDYKDATFGAKELTKEMKAEKEAIQKLDRQIKDLDKSMGQHQRNVGNYESAFGKLKNTIGFVVAGWTAGIAAVGGLITVMKGAVEGAMREEAQNRKLKNALDGSATATERLLRWKDRLMQSTMFGEDEIRGAITMGLELGRTELQTKKMVETAMGLSRVTGVDLNTAMMQLSGTYEGSLGKLAKFDSSIKDLTKTQLENGGAVDILHGKLARLMTEGVDTMEGRVKMMKQWWTESLEEIGFKVMDLFQGLQTGWMAIQAMMGGGVGKRELASGKAAATKAQQLAAHQEKMDQINAEIEQNKKLLGVNLATLNSQSEKIVKNKEEAVSIESLNEEMERLLDTVDRMVGSGAYETITRMTPKKGLVSTGATKTGLATQSERTAIPGSPSLENNNATSQDYLSTISQIYSQIDSIVNASFQNKFTLMDMEAAKDKENKEKELERAAGNRSKIEEINKRYAAKEAEREKERRKAEVAQMKYKKASGIVGAIINGALGVTNALSAPFPLNIVLPILMALTAAAEVALIASQPIPSYAKGRKGGPAEMANVGEKGRELIVDKSGKMSLTPATSTLTYLPEGASVISHEELLNATGQAANLMPKYQNNTAHLQEENEILKAGFLMLRKTIEDKQEVHLDINERGFATRIKHGQVWEDYINNHVRL